MIYLYSATGNTRRAARCIAETLSPADARIAEMGTGHTPFTTDDEAAGFMFPIYSWGLPVAVAEFIRALPEDYLKSRYVWGVCTCGDEAGTAMRRFRRLTDAELCASVQMPNTYVLLPGFTVDAPEVAKAKLEAAPARLGAVAAQIMERAREVYDVHEGSLPWLRSAVYPIYKRWGARLAHWAASDACIGCGQCAKICPTDNITMKDGRPVWGTRCSSCCACFHTCPARAIDAGRLTRGKTQLELNFLR